MSNYKLQVFKPFENGDESGRYRFVIIDAQKTSGYPSNFVCLLPKKILGGNRTDRKDTIFVQKFGYDIAYAAKLIKEAIRNEQDLLAVTELKKRLDNLRLEMRLLT